MADGGEGKGIKRWWRSLGNKNGGDSSGSGSEKERGDKVIKERSTTPESVQGGGANKGHGTRGRKSRSGSPDLLLSSVSPLLETRSTFIASVPGGVSVGSSAINQQRQWEYSLEGVNENSTPLARDTGNDLGVS